MKKEELIIEAASEVHKEWCMQEYKGFFDRAQKELSNGKSMKDALYSACYKNGTKRNELWIDAGYMVGHETMATNCLKDFDVFMHFVRATAFEIKRFTKRTLTLKEQIEMGGSGDYKKESQEENILRNFKTLSVDSKKENLEAAISAYKVYEELKRAGVTDEQLTSNSEIRNLIGVAIHTDWMRRNPEHPNDSLKVSYEELDDWTKSQDLTVFDALVKVARKNNVEILSEDGYRLPDYLLEEQQTLSDIKGKKK